MQEDSSKKRATKTGRDRKGKRCGTRNVARRQEARKARGKKEAERSCGVRKEKLRHLRMEKLRRKDAKIHRIEFFVIWREQGSVTR